MQRDLQNNYLAVYDFSDNSLQQLETEEIPTVYQTNEGDGNQFVGVTDFGKRIESQWTGTTKKDIYAINVKDGSKKLVKKIWMDLFRLNLFRQQENTLCGTIARRKTILHGMEQPPKTLQLILNILYGMKNMILLHIRRRMVL